MWRLRSLGVTTRRRRRNHRVARTTASTRRSANAGIMLAKRLRRLDNIITALAVLYGVQRYKQSQNTHSVRNTLAHCRPALKMQPHTLRQRWADVRGSLSTKHHTKLRLPARFCCKGATMRYPGGGGAGVFVAGKLFISTGLDGALKISHFITCLYRKVLEVNYLLWFPWFL